VCAHLLGLPNPPKRLVLIGYSYGSVIASAAAGEVPEVVAYAAISYPFTFAWALTLFQSGAFWAQAQTDKPKLFIMGNTVRRWTWARFLGVTLGKGRAEQNLTPMSPLSMFRTTSRA
jgi:alpha/beta superfamily hydrolase